MLGGRTSVPSGSLIQSDKGAEKVGVWGRWSQVLYEQLKMVQSARNMVWVGVG
jgi:hypothetical protein